MSGIKVNLNAFKEVFNGTEVSKRALGKDQKKEIVNNSSIKRAKYGSHKSAERSILYGSNAIFKTHGNGSRGIQSHKLWKFDLFIY